MNYPTLEQYNEALQHPAQALLDADLRRGSIATTGLGLPLALCGGFALTYTVSVGATKYAVRCFHKKSNALENRYIEISKKLRSIRSPYFVNFEFQPSGVRVGGGSFPIVKMAWASGTTLGEFVEKNHRNSTQLESLRDSLSALSRYLESQGIAHGDIQPGNVMVSDAGKTLRLIDYDGMFVDALKSLGSAELGHRNFQHPSRVATCWDSSLDRFSFICLDVALKALSKNPNLWKSSQSDGDSILFKANDFADPNQSSIFSDLNAIPIVADDAKNLAAICQSSFASTPTLEDFRQKRNIPRVAISAARAPTSAAKYISAFPVLDATDYSQCLSFVGDKVELIGRIVEVKKDTTRHGKQYIFINFGPWQGSIVKVSIWHEGLLSLANHPDEGWIGKWISVVGLMEPPYVSRRYKYSHLSVSITQGAQLHLISEKEAKFRLGSQKSTIGESRKSSNREILGKLKSGDTSPSFQTASANRPSQGSSNQSILKNMRRTTTGAAPASQSRSPSRPSPGKSSSSSNCFIATAVYGYNAPETQAFRQWRDESLTRTTIGRIFTSTYYLISPHLVSPIQRYSWLYRATKYFLNLLLRFI